jgi:hypothetical protein
VLLVDDEVAIGQLDAEAHRDVLAPGLYAVLLEQVLDEWKWIEDG